MLGARYRGPARPQRSPKRGRRCRSVPTFTPSAFPIAAQPMIAPYWGDVDIRYTGGSCQGSAGQTCNPCTPCHNPDRREGGVDLCGDHSPLFSQSYWTIMHHGLIADGRNERVAEFDPSGELVWEVTGYANVHDADRLPNGNTLLVKWRPLPKGLVRRVKGGYNDPEDDPKHMLGDMVLEVTAEGEIVRVRLGDLCIDFEARQVNDGHDRGIALHGGALIDPVIHLAGDFLDALSGIRIDQRTVP